MHNNENILTLNKILEVKKTVFLTLAATFMLVLSSTKAYSSKEIFLSNHLVPKERPGAIVGTVTDVNGDVLKDAVISTDKNSLFEIDKNGTLKLKNSVSLIGTEHEVFEITISSGMKSAKFHLVKDNFLRNIVVAHRGAWKHFNSDQNSIGSLKNAISLGCAWSEFDVWLSADNIPVVCHDPVVEGISVEKSPAATLTQISLKGDEKLPTLEEYINEAKKQSRTRLFLEIKPSGISLERSLELTSKVVEMVHNLNAEAWVKYISFSFPVLERIGQLDPSAKCAYLGSNISVEELGAAGQWGVDFNKSLFFNDSTIVERAHSLGMTVNVWTVNDLAEMKRLLQYGVDFITTDEPALLFELINSVLK